jgi:hypothetical protein
LKGAERGLRRCHLIVTNETLHAGFTLAKDELRIRRLGYPRAPIGRRDRLGHGGIKERFRIVVDS